MKFLVVDDSSLSRRIVRQCLQELGHESVEAADGATALEKYYLERPDFVVLDLVMPNMTGQEVLTCLKKLDPSSRVIICTADIQTSTRQAVREAGALCIINKPVRADQLAAALNTILAGQNAWPDPEPSGGSQA